MENILFFLPITGEKGGNRCCSALSLTLERALYRESGKRGNFLNVHCYLLSQMSCAGREQLNMTLQNIRVIDGARIAAELGSLCCGLRNQHERYSPLLHLQYYSSFGGVANVVFKRLKGPGYGKESGHIAEVIVDFCVPLMTAKALYLP